MNSSEIDKDRKQLRQEEIDVLTERLSLISRRFGLFDYEYGYQDLPDWNYLVKQEIEKWMKELPWIVS